MRSRWSDVKRAMIRGGILDKMRSERRSWLRLKVANSAGSVGATVVGFRCLSSSRFAAVTRRMRCQYE